MIIPHLVLATVFVAIVSLFTESYVGFELAAAVVTVLLAETAAHFLLWRKQDEKVVVPDHSADSKSGLAPIVYHSTPLWIQIVQGIVIGLVVGAIFAAGYNFLERKTFTEVLPPEIVEVEKIPERPDPRDIDTQSISLHSSYTDENTVVVNFNSEVALENRDIYIEYELITGETFTHLFGQHNVTESSNNAVDCLTVVPDVSGSMLETDPDSGRTLLEVSKEAINELLSYYGPEDLVRIIPYDTYVKDDMTEWVTPFQAALLVAGIESIGRDTATWDAVIASQDGLICPPENTTTVLITDGKVTINKGSRTLAVNSIDTRLILIGITHEGFDVEDQSELAEFARETGASHISATPEDLKSTFADIGEQITLQSLTIWFHPDSDIPNSIRIYIGQADEPIVVTQ